MFWHNFKYQLKCLVRNRMLVFWTLIFPIVLGTFFKLAFSDIEKSETFDVIDIAVVNNDEYKNNEFFKTAMESLSEGEDRLFDVSYTDIDKANELLGNDDIVGYVIIESDKAQVVVLSSGISETVLKTAVEEIEETSVIVKNLIGEYIQQGKPMEEIQGLVTSKLKEIKNMTYVVDKSNENMSYTMIEYYTLIAMLCLYGGIMSMYVAMNMSAKAKTSGKRVSVASTPKGTLIISGLLASYLVQVFGLILLFLYTIFVLEVDYGSHFGHVVILALAGSLAGLSLGVLVNALVKSGESAKTGVLIGVVMLGCFFSGMMGITMKYIIDVNVPIINILNPANMITDGFYVLYYYSSLDKYYFDLVSLILFSVLMLSISIGSLRRQRYDSI